MRINIDELKKKYPHLAKELLGNPEGDLVLTIRKPMPDPWRGYLPGPIDYIRRCHTREEAIKVIDYLEKHGEITKEEADELRNTINTKGLEYFGPHKSDNYYYRKAVEYWKKLASATSSEQQ